MSADRVDAVAGLAEEVSALLDDSRRATAAGGADASGSIRVTLDADGRVAAVAVGAGWRRLGADGLPGAVLDAVRDAATRRFTMWAAAFGEPGRVAGTDRPAFDRGDVQRRLQAVATAAMSETDRRSALLELLALAESIERGIDEVSAAVRAASHTAHTGQSPDRHVRVTVTGAGAVTAVRFDGPWLSRAREADVGRQVTAAFRAAYAKAAARGVDRLIADSSLGEARRAAQDPLGLARRLRMTD